jgi:hypothetical protein
LKSPKFRFFLLASVFLHAMLLLFFFRSAPLESPELLSLSLVEGSAFSAAPGVLSPPSSKNIPTPSSKLSPAPASPARPIVATAPGLKEAGSAEAVGPGLQLKVVYPPQSLNLREEGSAEYRLRFSADLRLLAYERLKSTGFERLDRAVEKALNERLQSPLEIKGVVDRQENLVIDFRLKSADSRLLFTAK